MKRKYSLFVKFLVVAMICIIIPLLISGFYSVNSFSNSLESEAKKSLSSATISNKNYVDVAFKDQMDLATSISNESEVVNYFKEFKKTNKPNQAVLTHMSSNLETKFKNSNGLYENMILQVISSDLNKVTVADGIGGKSIGDKRPATQNSLKALEKEGKAKIGSIMASPITGRPVITINAPILDTDTKLLTASFLNSIDLNILTQNIVKSNSNESIKTFLIDPTGLVVSSENSSQILKLNLSKEKGDMADFYGTMKANNSGIGYFTINGVKNIASYTKSNITKLYIVSFIPVEQYMSKINSVRNGIIIVIIISLIISSLLILLFSRSITKPLKLAVEYIRTFALGDFSKEVPDKAMRVSDETGDLMVSLNTMQKSIRTMLKTVVKQSEKIESSVIITNKNMYDLEYQIEEISSTTEELSASMEETAASSEELSASSDELGKAVTTISEKAQEGAENSGEIRKRAQELKESAVVSKKVAEDIRNKIYNSLKQSIEQSKAVTQINELTESILQISSQTNLLALNAAIEAARAGEAGKGFAVVAEEVRKLAEDSKNITNEIQRVTKIVVSSVESLKYNSENVLDFIDSTVIKDYISMVDIGEQYYKDANYVGNLVNDFSSKAQEVSSSLQIMINVINEISTANNEMAIGTGNIANKASISLQKSNDVSKVTSDTNKVSEELKTIVSEFKI
ncbi:MULTISPECIES: methyl-accepting chemotaxis protein [Clostridium]|uniref:Methyl-accepting chemotaxis protein n=1 Tax=Clostridium frigoriphilum TaxID=443253 RepID=A0ABU7ULY9_9CLOT|nr:methyl-accepting chemotaxis protein [Clostridium sp. DSM 17811]MBU3099688.1 methyl-accepting chemotaxis protein [Clostridium sp. DSM 17811]